MKPNSNTNQNTNQHSQQNEQSQQPQEPSMNPPEAAAKTDLHRVEETAQEGREAAENAHERVESLEQQVQSLEEKNEELQEFVGRVIGSIHRMDEHLDAVEDEIGAWGNSYKSEPIAEMFGLPEPNARMGDDGADRDDAGDVQDDGDGEEIVPDDVEPTTIQIPFEDAEEV